MVLNNLKRGESIDKSSPVPMYYQIMNQLREMILEGEYAVNSLLPPERELVETYQVSRMTIRQAILELVNEGILVRRRGVGTFIAPHILEQPLSSLTCYTKIMSLRGMNTGAHIIPINKHLSIPHTHPTIDLQHTLT